MRHKKAAKEEPQEIVKEEPVKEGPQPPDDTPKLDLVTGNAAMDSRLLMARSEIERLNRQKVTLEQEVESVRNLLKADVEKKMGEVRKAKAETTALREKLEADKAEFTTILANFQKEKAAFDKERQAVFDLKEDSQKIMEKAANFIRLVRDGAAKL